MPRTCPPLTPDEVIAILLARGFTLDRESGSHATYQAIIRGKKRSVTVDKHYLQFDVRRIKDMIAQSGFTRKEFYGSTKRTAKKINLRAKEYPIFIGE